MAVQIVKNFISPELAQKIVSGYSNLLPETSETFQETVKPVWLWNLWVRHPDETKEGYPLFNTEGNISDSDLVSEVILLIKDELEKVFGANLTAFEAGLVRMDQGASNGLHADICNVDGSPFEGAPNGANHLEYSALLYLCNHGEDFTGGEIVFPKQEMKIEPKAGMLVLFPGDTEHTHEVRKVLSGHRYGIAMLFGTELSAAYES
jgi:hypothetical protein